MATATWALKGKETSQVLRGRWFCHVLPISGPWTFGFKKPLSKLHFLFQVLQWITSTFADQEGV